MNLAKDTLGVILVIALSPIWIPMLAYTLFVTRHARRVNPAVLLERPELRAEHRPRAAGDIERTTGRLQRERGVSLASLNRD